MGLVKATVGLSAGDWAVAGPVLLEMREGHTSSYADALAVVSVERTAYYVTVTQSRPTTSPADHVCGPTFSIHGHAQVGARVFVVLCSQSDVAPELHQQRLDFLVPYRLEDSAVEDASHPLQGLPYRVRFGGRSWVDQLPFPPGLPQDVWGERRPKYSTYGHPALLEAIGWHYEVPCTSRFSPSEHVPIPQLRCFDRVHARAREDVALGDSGEGYLYVYGDRLVFAGSKRGATRRFVRESTRVSVSRTGLHRWMARNMLGVQLAGANAEPLLRLDVNRKAMDRIGPFLTEVGWLVTQA